MKPSKKCKNCGREYYFIKQHTDKCDAIYEQKNSIKKDYSNGTPILKLRKKYSIQAKSLHILLKQMGIYRNLSEATKIAHRLYPVRHTPESKAKLRESRLKYMKEHPEDTAWRKRSKMSYPEKLFKQMIDKNKWAEKYDVIKEYPIFPFYTDFAFLNIKIDFEIDGSQHWLEDDRIKQDKRKEKTLLEQGWHIYRIPEFKLRNEFEKTERDIINFLNNIPTTPKIFEYENDIVEYEKIKAEKIRKQKEDAQKYRTRIKKEFKERYDTRLPDFKKVYPSWGWTTTLGEMWGITGQRVGKYCKKRFPEYFPAKSIKK